LSAVSEFGASSGARRSLSGLIYVVLAVGIFSTSSVTVRLAAPVSSEAISFGRLLIASVVILLAARWRRRNSARTLPFPLTQKTLPRFALYGLFAAGHFLLFIASLSYTTIAHSLAIVYTSPVFVTLFAAVGLREPLRSRQWLSLPVVLGGIAVLAGFEPRHAASEIGPSGLCGATAA
jgi:drug/metabolite transporter (DMT)-like permease